MTEELKVTVTADTEQFMEALDKAIAKVKELEQACVKCIETAASAVKCECEKE
jgi:hypothetical protein